MISRTLLVLLLLPAASALTVTDPAGDTVIYAWGAEPPGGNAPEADLLELVVTESLRHVRFELLAAPIPEVPDFWATVNFTMDGEAHRLEFHDQQARFATHYVNRPPGISQLPMHVDDGRRVVEVPKTLLFNPDGRSPLPGDVLEVTGGYSISQHIVGNDLYIADRFTSSASLVFELGAMAPIDVSLSSPSSERVSNGAATVFVYELVLESLSNEDRVVDLSAVDVPGPWQVRFPVPQAQILAGETRSLPVLVDVPFAHQHGVFESFIVEAHDADRLLSNIVLGIDYTETPQPAGHHPELWFHIAPDRRASPNEVSTVFMSTVEDDWRAGGESSHSSFCKVGSDGYAHYEVKFATPVFIGLDFDLDQTIAGTIPLEAAVDLPGIELDLNLNLQRGFTLALGNVTTDLQAGQNLVEFTMTLQAKADLIRPGVNQAMWFEVKVASDLEPCRLVAWGQGGGMHLPLVEYHDALPLEVADILTASAAPATVGPGSRLAIPMHIASGEPESFELRVFGRGSEHAHILPETLRTDEGGRATATLTVEVPDDAVAGHPYDLIVEAIGETSVGLERIAFVVVPVAPTIQEAPAEPAERDSPALGAGLVGGIAAAALLRRR